METEKFFIPANIRVKFSCENFNSFKKMNDNLVNQAILSVSWRVAHRNFYLMEE